LELLQSGVERTNLEFGGKNPDVTRVLFTHGSFDGWTKVAAETDVGPESPVIIIDGKKTLQLFDYSFSVLIVP